MTTNRRHAHSCNYSPNLCLCFKATYIFLFALGWWGVITNLRVVAPRSDVILTSWFVLSSAKVTSDVPVTPHDAFHLFLFSQAIALTPFDVTSLPTTYTKNVQTAHAQRTRSLSEHPAFWDMTPYRLFKLPFFIYVTDRDFWLPPQCQWDLRCRRMSGVVFGSLLTMFRDMQSWFRAAYWSHLSRDKQGQVGKLGLLDALR